MRKNIWGGIVVVAVVVFGGYALWSASRTNQPVATTTDNQTGQTSVPSETTNPASTGTTPTGVDNGIGDSSSPTDTQPATYKDGAYTGKAGSAAPYGQVQVSVTISGGKLASIKMLQSPNSPGHTAELTATVFPALIKEAISKQSAHVDIVSGATQDTEGFQDSLSSALIQAQS